MNKSKRGGQEQARNREGERRREGEKERLAQKYEVSHFFATAGSCTEGRMQKKHLKTHDKIFSIRGQHMERQGNTNTYLWISLS